MENDWMAQQNAARAQRALEDKQEVRKIMNWAFKILGLLLIVVAFAMFGCPKYNVWEQGLKGQAELKRAEQNRQIKIQEASAIEESAKRLAGADTIRAHGIARSQEIIGAKLTPEYLRWFYIDNLEKNQNAVFYIPTEAGLPILEAGRAWKPNTNPQ